MVCGRVNSALCHGHDYLYITSAFILWTITSFLSHQSAKYFLILTGSDLFGVAFVSFLQLSLCYLCTTLRLHTGEHATAFKYLAVVGHVIATVSTNYSLSVIHPSSTLAVKMLEPITSALIQWIMFDVSVPIRAVFSLPVIISGAVIFTGNPQTNSGTISGIAMAVISTLALAFRNIAMKRSSVHGNTLLVRSYKLAVIVVSIFIISIPFFDILISSSFAFAYTVAVTSAVAHVLYSFLSIAMVLKSVSVVTHAVMNTFKRVLVVGLLCVFGHREVTLFNISGLACSTLGLFLYAILSRRQEADTARNSSQKGRAVNYRILFVKICCVASICLVVVTLATERHLLFVRPFSMTLTFESKSQTDPVQQFVNRTIKFDGNAVQVGEFLKWRLVDHPNNTNILSKLLTSHHAIIEEAKRIHTNIFEDLLGRFKYAMLFDVADYENKGDPAIAVGEIHLLRRMGIRLVYYCTTRRCSKRNINKALRISESYSADNLVLLLQGGGNLFSYKGPEAIRIHVLKTFPNHTIILFPQSIWPWNTDMILSNVGVYNNHSNLTIAIRDKPSMVRLRSVLKNPDVILVPDMAFEIGSVARFHPPAYDILWLQRTDAESDRYVVPRMPANVSSHVGDWLGWTSAMTKGMEYAFNMATNGLTFLQRGRVVVTDRLHGHILATLLGIPHVLLDTNNQKVSGYRETWTRGLEYVKMARNGSEAMTLAVGLLHKYSNTLPKVLAYDSTYN